MVPTFTSDWFTSSSAQGEGSWLKHVVPRLSKIQSVNWLEIGSYEGRSALWTATNLLHGSNAKIVCVDPWDQGDDGQVEERFDQNTKSDVRILKMRGRSRQVLPLLRGRGFHGAYVDGLHDKDSVLFDAWEAARLLVPGGILIFDDYQVSNDEWGVKPAVDKFLFEMKDEIDVIYRGVQLIGQLRGCPPSQ